MTDYNSSFQAWAAQLPAGSTGVSSPPVVSQPFAGNPPQTYFSLQSQQEYFQTVRMERIAYNTTHRPGPVWTEEDELALVDKLHMGWYDQPWPHMPDHTNYINLDALQERKLYKRKVTPFKIDYQTLAEFKLRLVNTVISIKGHPFLVTRVSPKANSYVLSVKDADGKTGLVDYKDLKDLRSIPPMYVTMSGTAGWLARYPGRVYQQGINRQNTTLRTVDSRSVALGVEPTPLMKGLRDREDTKWDTTISRLFKAQQIHSARFTDDFAAKLDNSKIIACYRGRPLGEIIYDEVLVEDEDDLLQDWIDQSAKDAGLHLKAA